ncbi:MAG: hypothetical protein Q4C07_03760 [Eubacteriales bacterium]|nr:hypothetical protein [Eubacteriales bacterium]
MYHIARDQRERKSAAKLSAAAERILLSPEPQRLSVSLLSAEAGVSRTTFYRLFDEPDDVLQYTADETFRRILQGYVDLIDRAKKHDLSVPNPRAWYEEGVRKNAGLIAGIIHSGKSDILRTAHKKALREFAPVLFPDLDPGTDEFLFFIEMRAAVFIASMTAWVETGERASMEDIRRYAARQLKFFSED